ncbi:hypothetical protein ON010_g16986 [Phytophthora cinnamomi]|nr:hypothetical protein ON010_g16986 [Phytophthora cinnamomi]
MQLTAPGSLGPHLHLSDAVDHPFVRAARGGADPIIRARVLVAADVGLAYDDANVPELGREGGQPFRVVVHPVVGIAEVEDGDDAREVDAVVRHADAVAARRQEAVPAHHDARERRHQRAHIGLPEDLLARVVTCRPPARLVREAVVGVARHEHRVVQRVRRVVIVAARVGRFPDRGVELDAWEAHVAFHGDNRLRHGDEQDPQRHADRGGLSAYFEAGRACRCPFRLQVATPDTQRPRSQLPVAVDCRLAPA